MVFLYWLLVEGGFDEFCEVLFICVFRCSISVFLCVFSFSSWFICLMRGCVAFCMAVAIFWSMLFCRTCSFCFILWFSVANALFSVFNCFISSIKSLICFDMPHL